MTRHRALQQISILTATSSSGGDRSNTFVGIVSNCLYIQVTRDYRHSSSQSRLVGCTQRRNTCPDVRRRVGFSAHSPPQLCSPPPLRWEACQQALPEPPRQRRSPSAVGIHVRSTIPRPAPVWTSRSPAET